MTSTCIITAILMNSIWHFSCWELKRTTASLAMLIASSAVVWMGCDKKSATDTLASDATASAPSSSFSASVASGTPIPSPPPAANGANNPSTDPMATMFGTMATELKNRPDVHPSVDDGFAAFAKAGVPINAPKQSLGTTYKASYCSHGLTDAKDLSVLLCEYPNEAQAAAGLAESKKLFPGLASRQTWSHKSLLMATIFQDPKLIASATPKQRKVLATFNAL
jgi:hypothetical protein